MADEEHLWSSPQNLAVIQTFLMVSSCQLCLPFDKNENGPLIMVQLDFQIKLPSKDHKTRRRHNTTVPLHKKTSRRRWRRHISLPLARSPEPDFRPSTRNNNMKFQRVMYNEHGAMEHHATTGVQFERRWGFLKIGLAICFIFGVSLHA